MAEVKQPTQVTEVKAFARGIHISPRKVRLVADMIRLLPVDQALTQLSFITKKAALPIRKLLAQAIANASHNFQIAPEQLYIKYFTVDGGRVFERYMPRAQGRAFPVRKRTSHLNLILGVRPVKSGAKAGKTTVVSSSKKAKTDMRVEIGSIEKRAGKKKAADPSQVGPKEDAGGKHYTGFDKKGNE